MKKILIYSDSLALPREVPEKVFYEETYAALLSKDYQVLQFSKGAATIDELFEQTFYYKMFNPNFVILQSGVVDYSTRPFTKFEEHFLRLNLFTRGIRLILKILTKKWLRNVRRIVWTKEKKYRKFCHKFKSFYNDTTIFAIGILPVRKEYEALLHGMTKRVNRYNAILKDIFGDNYIDMSDMPDEGIMSDHHHLTAIGQKYVYDTIIEKLKTYEKNI